MLSKRLEVVDLMMPCQPNLFQTFMTSNVTKDKEVLEEFVFANVPEANTNLETEPQTNI